MYIPVIYIKINIPLISPPSPPPPPLQQTFFSTGSTDTTLNITLDTEYKWAARHIPQLCLKITLHQKVQAAYLSLQIKHNPSMIQEHVFANTIQIEAQKHYFCTLNNRLLTPSCHITKLDPLGSTAWCYAAFKWNAAESTIWMQFIQLKIIPNRSYCGKLCYVKWVHHMSLFNSTGNGCFFECFTVKCKMRINPLPPCCFVLG